ncbi:hypothetical protein HYV49_05475 [Candidatus Pacearchaeota archaeon]|nr:hypothetical protein [Candidatus Pacearchaeota archaeon]
MAQDKTISEILENIVGEPDAEHQLIYDSPSDTLEPIYFWILDLINGMFSGNVEKLVDNFASSHGSGHFSELGQKATRMQDEAMKILGAINQVLKSIINILYDLREFEMRLHHYDDANSSDEKIKESGNIALKQIWMDNVDIKKGRASINNLSTAELMFTTLRDAFMSANSVKKADSLDLNDRVKRILKARLSEFLIWKETSEKELRKRFEIEKTYLKSQVGTLQLYTRWVKPYLKTATLLEMKETKSPELVTAFNTILLELTLFAKKPIKIEEEALQEGTLPIPFAEMKFKRNYYYCMIIDFSFRGIPQRVTQRGDYTFGGKTTISFKAYAMNDDEIMLLKKKLEESDFEDALKLADMVTSESLETLKEQIDYYLKEKDEEDLQ